MNETDGLYDSPVSFTTKQRFLLWLLPPIIAFAAKVLMRTCRIEVCGRDTLDRLLAAGQPVVVPFWHETVAMAAWVHRGSGGCTITSYSYDGELAARVVRRFGMRAARGSSSRGGSHALHGLEEAIAQCPLIGFTLDGPRGPRRIAKPGVAIIAARTNAVIIPNAYTAYPCWRLKSWDRFMIPKPFARIVCIFGEAMAGPLESTREQIEQHRSEIEGAVNSLQSEVESRT